MSTVNHQGLQLSHSDLIAVLYHLYRVVEREDESKIRSRFKNFQKAGMPSGSRPTRGSHQNYSFDQVCEMVLAFELSEFGMAPTEIYRNFFERDKTIPWRSLGVLLSDTFLMRIEANDTYDLYLSFIPNAISGRFEYRLHDVYGIADDTNASFLLTSSRRLSCINIGRLFDTMMHFYPERSLLKSGLGRPERRGGFN